MHGTLGGLIGSLRTATIALAALLLAPAVAGASTLKVTAGTLFYIDTDPTAANVVTVKASTDGKSLIVTDTGRIGGKSIITIANRCLKDSIKLKNRWRSLFRQVKLMGALGTK